MKYTLRALLAVSLLVGFYVLALGLAAGLVALVIELASIGIVGVALVKLGFFVLLAAFAIIKGLFFRRRNRDTTPDGLLVTEQDQPVLWTEVRALAAVVGTRVPDEIRLVAAVNAAVSEDAKLLGLVPGTRRLYLGVPLLLGMNRGQVRSVLAHELGHYSGKHTALGPVTYRGKEAIARVLGELGRGSLPGMVLAQYGRLYYAAAHSVSRRQELEADEFSARVAGTAAAASALREIAPLDAAWQHFVSSYAILGNDRGRRPADLFIGFSALLAEPGMVGRMAEIRAGLPEPKGSIYDTHPPLALRIAALEQHRTDPVVPDTSAALELLVEPARTLAALEDGLFDGRGLDPTRWEVLLPDAAYAAARSAAGYLSAAHDLMGESRNLDGLVDRLDPSFPLGTSDAAAAQEERAFLGGLLANVIAFDLVRRDAASFTMSWTGLAPLRLSDGTHLDPWSAARDAATNSDPAAFRAWAAANGIDLAAPVDLPAPSVEVMKARTPITPETDTLIGVLVPVRHRGGRALIVTRAGIMLPQISFSQRSAHMFRNYFGRSRSLAGKIAQTPIPALASRPGTIGWSWARIASLHVKERRFLTSHADLTLDDGQEIRIKYDTSTAGHGQTWPAMAHVLGARFLVNGRSVA